MISTIGIHEVRGYARLFASHRAQARADRDLRHARLLRLGRAAAPASPSSTRDGDERQRILAGAEESKPGKTFRFYPKVYKAAVAAANGAGSYEDYSRKVRELELEQPISLRHILDLRSDREPLARRRAPRSALHSYPIVISSMSFGSQGEIAYRAYAEAAKRINIVAMNGEGGEIRDMYGQLPALARPAGRLRPLRRDERDDQLVLPRRDQDRPGREARRGRPPAGEEGHRARWRRRATRRPAPT